MENKMKSFRLAPSSMKFVKDPFYWLGGGFLILRMAQLTLQNLAQQTEKVNPLEIETIGIVSFVLLIAWVIVYFYQIYRMTIAQRNSKEEASSDIASSLTFKTCFVIAVWWYTSSPERFALHNHEENVGRVESVNDETMCIWGDCYAKGKGGVQNFEKDPEVI